MAAASDPPIQYLPNCSSSLLTHRFRSRPVGIPYRPRKGDQFRYCGGSTAYNARTEPIFKPLGDCSPPVLPIGWRSKEEWLLYSRIHLAQTASSSWARASCSEYKTSEKCRRSQSLARTVETTLCSAVQKSSLRQQARTEIGPQDRCTQGTAPARDAHLSLEL